VEIDVVADGDGGAVVKELCKKIRGILTTPTFFLKALTAPTSFAGLRDSGPMKGRAIYGTLVLITQSDERADVLVDEVTTEHNIFFLDSRDSRYRFGRNNKDA
jgi:hypothetical protein